MPDLIAVDPGDVHVGVAFFDHVRNGLGEVEAEWECVDTQEFEPDVFTDALAETLIDNDINTLVFERWRLYGDHSRNQIGSEFPTAQLIGVMKYLVRINNHHAERHRAVEEDGKMLTCELPGGYCADPRKAPHHVPIIGQMADIKKPTIGILRHKGIKSTAKRLKAGGHCYDAELHGWYHILHGSEDPRWNGPAK